MTLWLNWIKQIKALSQAGQAYSKDPYDLERFDEMARISHAMLAEISKTPIVQIDQLFIPEKGYPTPKVDLRGGVIKDQKILLVREREDNCWTLPGGWADVCETPSEGVIREVFEESGFHVSAPRLIAIKDRDVHPYQPKFAQHLFKLFFLCQLDSGTPTINTEISEIGFFARNELPPLSQSRVLKADVEMMFQYHENPNIPVYVD